MKVQHWSKETPPPGGISYSLSSQIKNREEEDPSWRTNPKIDQFRGWFLASLYASEILTVQGNKDDSYVRTKRTCTASCCASKWRWYGRQDKFNMHHKTHAGGNVLFVVSVNRVKNGSKLGYCSLCTSAPMTLMRLWSLKRQLALAGIHV